MLSNNILLSDPIIPLIPASELNIEVSLPTEILALILSKLSNPQDHLSSSKVNLRWKNVIVDIVKRKTALSIKNFIEHIINNINKRYRNEIHYLSLIIQKSHLGNSVDLLEIKSSSIYIEKEISDILIKLTKDELSHLSSTINNPELQAYKNIFKLASLYKELKEVKAVRFYVIPEDINTLQRICKELLDLNDFNKAFEVFIEGECTGQCCWTDEFNRILNNPTDVTDALTFVSSLKESPTNKILSNNIFKYVSLILLQKGEYDLALSCIKNIKEIDIIIKTDICERLLFSGKSNLAQQIITDLHLEEIWSNIIKRLSVRGDIEVVIGIIKTLPTERNFRFDFTKSFFDALVRVFKHDMNSGMRSGMRDPALQLEACRRIISLLAGSDEGLRQSLQIDTCLKLCVNRLQLAVSLVETLSEENRSLALRLMSKKFVVKVTSNLSNISSHSENLFNAEYLAQLISDDEFIDQAIRDIALAYIEKGSLSTALSKTIVIKNNEHKNLALSALSIAHAIRNEIDVARLLAKKITNLKLREHTSEEIAKYDTILLAATINPISDFLNRFKPKKRSA